jgi:uncharacterized protein YbaR (Trm112 family)
MKPKAIERHVFGCNGEGHLQYIEKKDGEAEVGVYRCYNCHKLFRVVDKG